MIIINEKMQEYFDKTVEHMAKQGQRSTWVDWRTCMYRGERGLKCNFGIFIKDEEYTPELEMKNINKLVEMGFVEFSGEVTQVFAQKLQWVHDDLDNTTASAVKQKLYEIALEFGLDGSKIPLITKWER